PDLGDDLGHRALWRLMSDLVARAVEVAGDVPAPDGLVGDARVEWALGIEPGRLQVITFDAGHAPVRIHELGGLLRMLNVDRSGQALAEPGVHLGITRHLVSDAISMPPDWVVAGPGASLADLLTVMDLPVGDAREHPADSKWAMVVPADGLVRSPSRPKPGVF